jgi:Na+-driven multidrug efflux pump
MGIQGAALASSLAYFAAAAYLFIVIQRELKTSWKTLLLPSMAELEAYAKLWSSFRARLFPERASVGNRSH